MRRLLLTGFAALLLSACGKSDQAKPIEDETSGPQIATSIDEDALPLDRSDQISAIDAATGDARGMPRDGGSVVRTPPPQAKVAPAENAVVPTIAAPPPTVVAPVPVPSTPPAQ